MINTILTKAIVRYLRLDFRSGFCRNRRMSVDTKVGESHGCDCFNDHTREIKAIIPTLTGKLHKGQCGRIGVIGGSLEYTGAPFFSAISALKLGADLVYVICCREAAPVIKSYSPELIVYPFLDDPEAVEKLSPCLEKLHSMVIGPGLGRDSGVLRNVENIIKYCNTSLKMKIPLIVDADGLFMVTQNPVIVKDYRGPVILTPNKMEYSRLCEKLSIKESDFSQLAETLNCVLLLKKEVDTICNGLGHDKLKLARESKTILCSVPGSVRRCGGQGDILSGVTAVFAAWFTIKRYNGGINEKSDYFLANDVNLDDYSTRESIYKDRYRGFSLSCFAACCITRHCSHLGYEKCGRSMTATDMISHIHSSFVHFYGE